MTKQTDFSGERTRALFRGWDYKRTADDLKIKAGALRQWTSDQLQGARSQTGTTDLTTEQWLTHQRMRRLKMWSERREGTGWAGELWSQLQPAVQHHVDTSLSGLGVSYLMTGLPDLRFLYLNPQGEMLYRTTAEAVRGGTVWEGMSQEAIYSRVLNKSVYHQKAVRVARAVLEIGSWLGTAEMERAEGLIAPYRAFVQCELPGLWESSDLGLDPWAVTAEYPKVLTHWQEGKANLHFEVHWSYRPEWEVFHVVYEPKNNYTLSEMGNLRTDLQATGRLPCL